jgi:hypothetical protein
MARGRKTALTIHLTADDRQILLAWQRSRTIPAGQARRARLMLLLAEGMTLTAIAATVGTTRRFVYKWVRRFPAEGLEGLVDQGRRRRSARLSGGRSRGGQGRTCQARCPPHAGGV